MDWLDQMITSLAESANVDAATLTLTPDERREILDVARVASHSSGDRINAPLLCYVLGLLAANGVGLDRSIGTVKERAGS